MHPIHDIIKQIKYEVGGTMYPGDIYYEAYQAADKDPELEEEIYRLEQKYIKKWCDYFTFKERQKE